MKKIVLLSIVIHALLLTALAPWLKTTMLFSTAEEAQRTEEVRKRELARQEHERLEREKRRLDEETARKLREEAERQEREDLEEEVEKLREMREEIFEQQRELLVEFRERELEDILHLQQETLEQQAQQLENHVRVAASAADARNFVIANARGSHDGIHGFLDDVRVYPSLLEPPFASSEAIETTGSHAPAYYWPFDGDATEEISQRETSVDRSAKFVGRDFTLEQAERFGRPRRRPRRDQPEPAVELPDDLVYFSTRRQARIDCGSIEFGNAFTIVVDVRLVEASRPQILFTNSSSLWQSGFRLQVEEDIRGPYVKLLTTGESRQREQVTRSKAGVFKWDQWHEVALALDANKPMARIFIDGQDVTQPNGEVAEEVNTEGSTFDGSLVERAQQFREQVAQQVPTPDVVEQLTDQLEQIVEQSQQRQQENADLNTTRHELSRALATAEEIQQTLDSTSARSDLAMMNDTSTSTADKMQAPAIPTEPTAAEFYSEAVELEQQIAEAHADIDAAEQATAENSSYAEARSVAFPAVPNRPDLASQLSQAASAEPGTIGDLSEYRDRLAQATNEARDMSARAQSLVGSASPAPGQPGRPGQPSRGLQMASAMQSAASQNYGNGAVIDLTGFGGTGDSTQMRADLTGEGANMLPPSKPIAHLRLNQGDILQKAMPGRRFTRESLRHGWLYLDTWYVIGPWENHSRVDFDERHQPEQMIDFDARYHDGKFSKRADHPCSVLKWEFYQSDQVRCQPPRVHGASTYYAYTDVWFEESRDMLIAVASDDAARVWLNDQVIWQDNGLSPWNMGEGYRRVRFRKGYNSLLVRVENGPTHCVWSVLLCPPEVLK